MPPKVVASNSGISRGLAISSQAGRVTLLREGTRSCRVKAAGAAALMAAVIGVALTMNNLGRRRG